MFLLDTNHASRILQGHPVLCRRFARVGGQNISIPFVVCGELLYMAHKSERKEENIRAVQRFLARVRIVHSDMETCQVYAALKEAIVRHLGPKQRQKRKTVRIHQIGLDDNDLWIAATAIRHSFILVSADSDFQRIQAAHDLSLESWWQPEPAISG